MSWSFAHKDGLGVISHTGPNGYSFREVGEEYNFAFKERETAYRAAAGMSIHAQDVADESLRMPREGAEITVSEARRRMRADEPEAIEAEDRYRQGAIGSADGEHIVVQASCEHFADSCDKAKEDINKLQEAMRGDLIGESEDASMYEKYLGDGMYRLTYCIDGYDDASFETSATVEGKTELFNWIELKIPFDVMMCTTPKRWMVAPGDSLVDGYSDRYNDFGSVCRCGAPEAYDSYRKEYRCTKCGFDPMEV